MKKVILNNPASQINDYSLCISQMAFCMNTPDEMYVTTFPDNDVCRFLSFFKNSQNNSDYQWGMAVWDRIKNLLEAFGFFSNTGRGFMNMLIPKKQTSSKSRDTMADGAHKGLHSKQG